MRRKLVNEAQNSAVVSKINFKKNRTFFNQFLQFFAKKIEILLPRKRLMKFPVFFLPK